MTLIVEVENFLKETRCHIVEASPNEALLMICMPREQVIDEPAAASLDVDDDDLITWEVAAWQ